MKNFRQIKSGVIVEVQDYLYNVSIGGAFPYIKVPTAHPADKYYKDMDVVLGFINRDAPVIISRGFRHRKGKTSTKNFMQMQYYRGNWGRTGWVKGNSKETVPSGNGSVVWTFSDDEEPGFFDGTYLYGNKKVYNFPNMTVVKDLSGTEAYNDVPSLGGSDTNGWQVIGVFDKIRFRFKRIAISGYPDYINKFILKKDNLLDGNSENNDFTDEAAIGDGIRYSPIYHDIFCLYKYNFINNTHITFYGKKWEDLGIIDQVETPELSLPFHSGNCDHRTLKYTVYPKHLDEENRDITFIVGEACESGAEAGKAYQYWSINDGSFFTVNDNQVFNTFPVVSTYLGNNTVYKADMPAVGVGWKTEEPPYWSINWDVGDGYCDGFTVFQVNNNDYRFCFDTTDSDFANGEFVYRTLDWKCDYISGDKTTITLPFTSSDLRLYGGKANYQSIAYDNFVISDRLPETFVFFVYEDRDNNKIGVLGIDILNNEIRYHYSQDCSSWPESQKLWCYGGYLAFNAGDKWIIIR